MATRRWLLELAALSSLAGCSATDDSEADPIVAAMQRIRPLFQRKRPPGPNDWLAQHKEPGQTYGQFRAVVTRRAIDTYKTLRIVPIGPLSQGQSTVLEVVTEVMKPFFGLAIEMDP